MALPTITQAEGITRLTLKTTVSANVGDLLGHDGTDWVLADADARIPASFMAMESVAAGSTLQVCRAGVVVDTDAPYTAGASQYLSATAGAHTPTMPAITTSLTLIQRVGQALSASEMAFNLARNKPDILRVQVNYDPASLAAVTARTDTAAITGLLTTDIVRGIGGPIPTGTGWNSGLLIQSAHPAGADSLGIRLQNASAGALDGASQPIDFYIERP